VDDRLVSPILKISVITVCRNSAETIAFTLDSFFAQDWPDKELVIIDGASTDETLSIIKRYPQENIRLISEPDKGIYDAMNKGLALFTGDAVGFLNSDDAFHSPQSLALIAKGLSLAKAVHGNLDFVSDHTERNILRKWRAEKKPAKGFRTGWMPAHPTFYVHREVFQSVGFFSLTYKIAADYDWIVRALDKSGIVPFLINQTLVDMKAGGASNRGFSAHLTHWVEALSIRQKLYGGRFVDYAFFAKPIRKITQFLPNLYPRR
jgi:glycosyltransferase involved in cell wall biosynthesis